MAVVIDGSGSIGAGDFLLALDFAKDTVAAFADKQLFENGGTASFVQFDRSVGSGGPFSSLEDFNSFVDAQDQRGRGTNIPRGIAEGQRLLDAAPETKRSFMVVMTDGTIETGGDPTVSSSSVV